MIDSETPMVRKPKLRGWLHAGMFPIATAAGIVLVALAGTGEARIAATIFAATASILFGTSALLHRGSWSPRVHRLLRRWDHANIFLIIAGTLSLIHISEPTRRTPISYAVFCLKQKKT